ncbi:MAG: twin-arginine translocase subunit TatC [Methanobacterium sp.]|uniref:twin-arginine translocase subunit TatC n=1 Tax=Methanobacterium sp. TaxID=2164 RepID=UPI003D654EA6|nr:twin-arginine translocase subunit TatC [Methanobacterium sp.]
MEEPLITHFDELRSRLIRIAIVIIAISAVTFPFANQILIRIQNDLLPEGMRLIVIGPLEAIWAQIEVCMLVAFVIALPYIIYETMKFLKPALKGSENSFLIKTIPPALILFGIGAIFTYKIVLVVTLKFLIGYATSSGVIPLLSLGDFISFVLLMILVFGLLFELPLACCALASLDLIYSDTLTGNRKGAYVGILIIAGILTPDPTPFTQLIVTLPMIILFEISVLLIKYMHRDKKMEVTNDASVG